MLAYYTRFVPGADDAGIVRFLLTAAAIGMLYKENASISAAEVGCQGEVGVGLARWPRPACARCSAEPTSGSKAAEIGMEPAISASPGPIGGLVRSLHRAQHHGGGRRRSTRRAWRSAATARHFVPLDKVIETMRQTGRDMMAKYKETSLGGLAVNVVEC